MFSDNTVIEFNGVKQIDVNRDYLISDQHNYWELKILTDDFAIYESIIGSEYSKEIKRVIFSDPCTIVLWKDGTKTIVRCTDEKFDKEKGLAMCIAKKVLGNKGKYYDVFKKWLKPEYDSSPIEEITCSFTKCKWYKNPDYGRCSDCKKNHKEGHTKKR